jgi:hypothetical protein
LLGALSQVSDGENSMRKRPPLVTDPPAEVQGQQLYCIRNRVTVGYCRTDCELSVLHDGSVGETG